MESQTNADVRTNELDVECLHSWFRRKNWVSAIKNDREYEVYHLDATPRHGAALLPLNLILYHDLK